MSNDDLNKLSLFLLKGGDSNALAGLDEETLRYLTSLVNIPELQGANPPLMGEEVGYISDVSEIDEKKDNKQISSVPKEKNLNLYKRIEEEDFEADYSESKQNEPDQMNDIKIEIKIELQEESQEETPKKPEEDPYESAIPDDASISQFLGLLSGTSDTPDAFYRLSDLYYPENWRIYKELKLYIEKECSRNRFEFLENTPVFFERKKLLSKFFESLEAQIKRNLTEAQKVEQDIEENVKNINEDAATTDDSKDKIKLICEEIRHKGLLKIPKPEMSCFNKIASSSFYQGLKKEIRKGIFNGNLDEKERSPLIQPENKKNNRNEGKLSIHSITNNENGIFNSNYLEDSLHEEDELLLNFRNNLKKFGQLWGETRELSFERKMEIPAPRLFSVQEDIKIETSLNKNLNYYNKDVLELKNFIKIKEKPPLIIDLANESLFMKDIHGKYFLRPKPQKEHKDNQNPIELEDNLDQPLSDSSSSSKNSLPSRNKKTSKKEKERPPPLEAQTSFWNELEQSKKNKKSKIQHSRLAEKFNLNSFMMSSSEETVYHRFDLINEFLGMKNKREVLKPWKVEILKKNENQMLRNSLKRKREESASDELIELVDSFEIFKNRKRLSCKSDDFVLFEYMEQTPLVLSNIGMATKLYKYVYPQRAENIMKKLKNENREKNPSEEAGITVDSQYKDDIQAFKTLIQQTLGVHGSVLFLKNNDKLPLIGQLTDPSKIGVLILENNLFSVPIFKQKLPKTDFLLLRYRNEENQINYYLRKIDYIYVVGQIEPKLEVFSPNSRMLNNFIKRCLKFEIKRKFKEKGFVDLKELSQVFKSINDHNIRSSIRSLGGEQSLSDNKIFHYNKEILDSDQEYGIDEIDITPEEMCLYERMQTCLGKLKNFGLNELRTADKVNLARNKYIRNLAQKLEKDKSNKNPEELRMINSNNTAIIKKQIIARLVAEELHLTSWNLSQSFLTAKQTQGRLYLGGFGDPTNGHGGYSYVKKPLKTSRYEKDDKINKSDSLKDKPLGVTGTTADLRKLNMTYVNNQLTQWGYKPEYLTTRTRWQRIDLFREVCNKLTSDSVTKLDPDLLKFARAMRVTTKMQKEIYQSEINRLFNQLYEYLRREEVGKKEEGRKEEGKREEGVKKEEGGRKEEARKEEGERREGRREEGKRDEDEEEGVREEYLCEERIDGLIRREEREEGRKKKEKGREELDRLRKLRKKFGKDFND